MRHVIITISLLLCSNVFMTFAWYAHLKELNNKPWIIAALVSWGIALFEYMFQSIKDIAGSHHLVCVRSLLGVLFA